MINIKYSYRNFNETIFETVDPSEWNNTEIVGSCFYHENEPGTIVFVKGIQGVTFTRCNLDNVYIPEGNTLVECTDKRIKVQNDVEDWIVDEDNKPIEPLHKQRFITEGKSIDPKDLPLKYLRTETISKYKWDKTFGKCINPEGSWFKEMPLILSQEVVEETIIKSKAEYDKEELLKEYKEFDKKPEKLIDDGVKVKLKGQKTMYTIQGEGLLFKPKTKKVL